MESLGQISQFVHQPALLGNPVDENEDIAIKQSLTSVLAIIEKGKRCAGLCIWRWWGSSLISCWFGAASAALSIGLLVPDRLLGKRVF
jgi:hypothetical protein